MFLPNCYFVSSVALLGGKSRKEGNVFTTSNQTGFFGPVCAEEWNLKKVRFEYLFFNYYIINGKVGAGLLGTAKSIQKYSIVSVFTIPKVRK